jgi:hypothetical protein
MTMTDERMALIELIEKSSDADLVRDMLAFAAERLMAMEVDTLTGAPAGAPRGATSATATESGPGTHVLGGSSLPSPS